MRHIYCNGRHGKQGIYIPLHDSCNISPVIDSQRLAESSLAPIGLFVILKHQGVRDGTGHLEPSLHIRFCIKEVSYRRWELGKRDRVGISG